MRKHPLLKKVNYSRTLWEDYLSFRTDAVAYQFDRSGKLIKTNSFYANKGHNPFDENLALINDFVLKADFRSFFQAHASYDSIVANYSNYYMLDTMKNFLEKESGSIKVSTKGKYKIVLSPLVGRMGHRSIDSVTTADFPTLSLALVENNAATIGNQAQRAVEIHTIFTEMDHGYVNPITELFKSDVEKKLDTKYWDNHSGYKGLDCFNEYMTWALYNIFTKKYFQEFSDSVNTQWYYQNASRGFLHPICLQHNWKSCTAGKSQMKP